MPNWPREAGQLPQMLARAWPEDSRMAGRSGEPDAWSAIEADSPGVKFTLPRWWHVHTCSACCMLYFRGQDGEAQLKECQAKAHSAAPFTPLTLLAGQGHD